MNPTPIRWEEYLTVAGGSVTIHCVIQPEGFGSGILAGRPSEFSKRQVVGHVAIDMVRKLHPKPGEAYIFSFPDGTVVKK